MQLTREQKQHVVEHGYVKIPGVVPREKVEHVRRLIHNHIGEHGIDPATLATARARSYCDDLQPLPEVVGLCTGSPAWSILESALGEGNVIKPAGAQLALRFPSLNDEIRPPRGHLDGIPTATNGVPRGHLAHFTCLLGVLLADQPRTNAGNFTVWPGSHLQTEAHFKERGPRDLLNGTPKLDYNPPVQITGNAGDIVLAHYLLVHGVGPHVGPDIRYMAFFRIHHRDHKTLGDNCMTDAWHEWEGLRGMVAGV